MYRASVAAELRIMPVGGLGEVGRNMTVLDWGAERVVVDCGVGFPATSGARRRRRAAAARRPAARHAPDRGRGAHPRARRPHRGARAPDPHRRADRPDHRPAVHDRAGAREAGRGRAAAAARDVATPGVAITTGRVRVRVRPRGPLDSRRRRRRHHDADRRGRDDRRLQARRHAGEPDAGAATAAASARSVAPACWRCWATRRTPTSPVAPARRTPRSTRCTTSSPRPPGRVIVTSFASNIDRIDHAIRAADATSRRVTFIGRSVRRNMAIAERLGEISPPSRDTAGPRELERCSRADRW